MEGSTGLALALACATHHVSEKGECPRVPSPPVTRCSKFLQLAVEMFVHEGVVEHGVPGNLGPSTHMQHEMGLWNIWYSNIPPAIEKPTLQNR